jgi:hypothetical protein
MSKKNSRRFFLDFQEDGSVMITAPNRTGFDDRFDYPKLFGQSAVEGGGAISTGFHQSLEFAKRIFMISIRSVPDEKAETPREKLEKGS